MEPCLSILYRGPLASCNYGCPYCPFAKRHDTAAQLQDDRRRLERFTDWLEARSPRRHAVLFTPWGEALTRRWYREAMVRMSHLSHIDRVAVQTNLSVPLEWLADANPECIALWCTYHPGEVERDSFVQQCRRLSELNIRYSVGVVGLREHFSEIEQLRESLGPEVYLWVNAYKREDDYYRDDEIEQLAAIDHLFHFNNQRHRSLGRPCRTGESVISVDGQGDVRRCHFTTEVIGNIYAANFDQCLQPRSCPNQTCGCHIGYVHMPELKLYEVFGSGVLERIAVDRQHSASELR